MTTPTRSLTAVVAAAILAVAAVAAGAPAADAEKPTAVSIGGIYGLAAEGVVAATVATPFPMDLRSPQEQGVLALLLSRSLVRSATVSARFPPAPPCEVTAVALTHRLVAWYHECPSNLEFHEVLVVWAPSSPPRVAAHGGGMMDHPTPYLSPPVAGDGLLVFSRGGRLFRVLPDGTTRETAARVTPEDVDKGRILGWIGGPGDPASRLGLVDEAGRVIRTFAIDRRELPDPRAVALTGQLLLIQRAENLLEIRSATTGELLRRYRSDGGYISAFAATAGVAVVASGRRIEITRLSDSRRAYVTTLGGDRPADVAATDAGIFYADGNRIAFMPRSEILRRLTLDGNVRDR